MAKTPKVTKTTQDDQNLNAEVDLLSGVEVDKDTASRIKQDAGDFLVNKILESVANSKSPVKGGRFKASLSPDYAKKKKADGRGSKANLEFSGDLLDSLSFEETSDGIIVGHIGTDEAPKADGHNNHSGDSLLPERKYIPEKGEAFKKDIQDGLKRIVNDAIVQENRISKRQLRSVASKTALWALLTATYVQLSKPEIRQAVLRDDRLSKNLIDLDLLRFLD